jgi:hypothetical protein
MGEKNNNTTLRRIPSMKKIIILSLLCLFALSGNTFAECPPGTIPWKAKDGKIYCIKAPASSGVRGSLDGEFLFASSGLYLESKSDCYSRCERSSNFSTCMKSCKQREERLKKSYEDARRQKYQRPKPNYRQDRLYSPPPKPGRPAGQPSRVKQL